MYRKQNRLNRRHIREAHAPWMEDYKAAVEDQLSIMEDAAQGILEAELPEGIKYAAIDFGRVMDYGEPNSYTHPASVAVTVEFSLDIAGDDNDLTDRQITIRYKSAINALLQTAVEALQDVTRMDDTIKQGDTKNMQGGHYKTRFTVRFWTDFDVDVWYTDMEESRKRNRRVHCMNEDVDSHTVRAASDELRRAARNALQDYNVRNAKIDIRLLGTDALNPSLELKITVPGSYGDDNVFTAMDDLTDFYTYRRTDPLSYIKTVAYSDDYDSDTNCTYVYTAVIHEPEQD